MQNVIINRFPILALEVALVSKRSVTFRADYINDLSKPISKQLLA